MNSGSKSHRPPVLPSEVSEDVGVFDRFAQRAAGFASRAPFFAASVLLVIAWLAEGMILVITTGSLRALIQDNFQLQINTLTTIITFLLVALLQNSNARSDQAVQHKLNAIADGLADLMDSIARDHDDDHALEKDVSELRAAVGLEQREGTASNTQKQERSDGTEAR